jgi:hypothetical protein
VPRQVSKVEPHAPQEEAKAHLINKLDTYVQVRIRTAVIGLDSQTTARGGTLTDGFCRISYVVRDTSDVLDASSSETCPCMSRF